MKFFPLNLAKKIYKIAIIDPMMDISTLPNATNLAENLINILASGSSINSVNLAKISQQPCIFVNGSITLVEKYHFAHPVAYVITDPRFIRHNLAILQQHYQGQCPLYLTQAVLEKLVESDPTIIEKYHQNLLLIYSVERPITAKPTTNFLKKLVAKWQTTKIPLTLFKNNPYFIIEEKTQTPIGVSLDIRHGFVEAGTVAFVATQLAYSLGFSDIHLYGVDLVNASEPRFYENAQNIAPNKLEPAIYNRIVPSFDLLAKVYQNNGVMVYNHSPVSKDLFNQLPFLAD